MLLDALKDFEWLNEPEEVYFGENGMKVKAMPDTDFWVNARHKFSKDNGHFFFKRGSGDFTVTAKWRFYRPEAFEQCGLMVRIDKNNWLKLSLMLEKPGDNRLATICATGGCADWALHDFNMLQDEIWYKIRRCKGEYLLYCSDDGERFHLLRRCALFHDMDEVKIGAYICSPQRDDFEAVLENIEITQNNRNTA